MNHGQILQPNLVVMPNSNRDVPSEITNTIKNLNTILLYIVLGVLGVIGSMGIHNAVELSRIAGQTVSREEIEQKFNVLRIETIQIQKDVMDLRLQVARIPKQ